MPLLPRRFERLQAVLNRRMGDLSLFLEHVEKPHNLSAILRSCDAVGVLEAHAVCMKGRLPIFNDTALGSQKWVPLRVHANTEEGLRMLKEQGLKIYGTRLGIEALDYRDCDFTGPTAFLLGAEKWGLSDAADRAIDQPIVIPTHGMVQSLNVSVAAAILLFEALRQRQAKGLVPTAGEGMAADRYKDQLFEWAYPEVAAWCRREGHPYPELDGEGRILRELPRGVKMRC